MTVLDIVMTVLGMVAQMERRFIKDRQREGIERAKADGVYWGGKRRVCRETVKARRLPGMARQVSPRRLGARGCRCIAFCKKFGRMEQRTLSWESDQNSKVSSRSCCLDTVLPAPTTEPLHCILRVSSVSNQPVDLAGRHARVFEQAGVHRQ